MRTKYSRIKVANIIFSVLCIIIGLLELITGSDSDSRFYYVDNFFIRIIGLLFIIAGIGMLLKNLIAWRATIILSIISILELIVTFDYSYSMLDIVVTFIIMGIIYLAPVIFLLLPRVKKYYIDKGTIDEGNIDEEEKSEFYKTEYDKANMKENSGVGIASFVISLVSILLIIICFSLSNSNSSTITEVINSPADILLGLAFIGIFMLNVCGFGLGIAGLFFKKKKKTLSIWGIVLNLLLIMIFILILIIGIYAIRQQGNNTMTI